MATVSPQASLQASLPGLALECWLPLSALPPHVPVAAASWLRAGGLLTARLRHAAEHAFRQPFNLRVIDQQPVLLDTAQRGELQVQVQTGLRREVVLCAGALPLMFAQTLIPDATLEQEPWLSELGTMSLGEALSLLGDVERGEMTFAELPRDNPLSRAALSVAGVEPPKDGVLWARRAWVAVRGKRLLVQEVFLPAVLAVVPSPEPQAS